jgi:hypothetical protein
VPSHNTLDGLTHRLSYVFSSSSSPSRPDPEGSDTSDLLRQRLRVVSCLVTSSKPTTNHVS